MSSIEYISPIRDYRSNVPHKGHIDGDVRSVSVWRVGGPVAALKSKHYQYQYTLVLDAGHCDRKVRDQTLSEALEWARRGYRR